MSKAKYCKGKEMHWAEVYLKVASRKMVYLNGRIMATKLMYSWNLHNFVHHTWNEAIRVVSEKAIIQRVLNKNVKP